MSSVFYLTGMGLRTRDTDMLSEVPTIPTIGPPLDTLSAVYEKHNEQDIWNWFINIDRMVALRQGATTMLSQIEWENRTMAAELDALSSAQDAEEEREPWCRESGRQGIRMKSSKPTRRRRRRSRKHLRGRRRSTRSSGTERESAFSDRPTIQDRSEYY